MGLSAVVMLSLPRRVWEQRKSPLGHARTTTNLHVDSKGRIRLPETHQRRKEDDTGFATLLHSRDAASTRPSRDTA